MSAILGELRSIAQVDEKTGAVIKPIDQPLTKAQRKRQNKDKRKAAERVEREAKYNAPK